MKISRSYLSLTLFLLMGMALANIVSLTGYFQAVETSGGGTTTEKRLLAQFQQMHEQLKTTEDPEMVKRQLRSLESVAGQGANSEGPEKLRKTYAPVIAIFASKPKEAEPRYLLMKKRELMEGLVNAYRKEIPAGPVPVRAAYLNILFDTQNSLLNEDDETELVYIKRNRERFQALKTIVPGPQDQGLGYRVSILDGIFQSYERGFEHANQWRQQKAETLAKAEKSLPKLARDFLGSKDQEAEDYRRSFIYSCIFSLLVLAVALIVLYVSHKVFKLKFESRLDSILHLIRQFGRDRTDVSFEKNLNLLLEDPDWSPLARGMVESETEFLAKYQTLISVPKSIQCPYVVFSKDRLAQYWNKEAGDLFALGKREGVVALDDLIREDMISSREGQASAVVEMIRNSFSAPKDDVFEFICRQGDTQVPFELLSYPISLGPLAGGKIYLFREIRNEMSRVQKAVALQLERVRAYVNKISNRYPVEIEHKENDLQEVQAALEDLTNMKRNIDEREALWKSETSALLDQVSKQKEILVHLSTEIQHIREVHGSVLELVTSIHSNDEHWHDEVCALERELERWRTSRERLDGDLAQHGSVMDKAKLYEKEARDSAGQLQEFLVSYETVLAQLTAFSDEAKIHAVNMGFVKDPAYREFAANSRAYAHEIGRFVDNASRIAMKVKEFLARHPASDLTPLLSSSEVDPTVLQAIRTEEERLRTFVLRWKEAGRDLVTGGEKALGLLRQADKRTAVATQLGETVQIINHQAQGNLERWS